MKSRTCRRRLISLSMAVSISCVFTLARIANGVINKAVFVADNRLSSQTAIDMDSSEIG